MKQIYVFIGDPMTGKSILANWIKKEPIVFIEDNMSLYDDVEIKNLILNIKNDKVHEIFILITSNYNQLNHLTDRLKLLDINVSLVEFKQLRGNTTKPKA